MEPVYIIFISLVIGGILLIVFYDAKESRNHTKEMSLEDIKIRITRINRQLLRKGLNCEEIMEFWEDCMAEAEIQHNLPPCRCGDVNQCELWCRAKARFVMNPPQD